ncbi:MAG: LPS assembly lipoprotein LptE [Gallionella sp.]
MLGEILRLPIRLPLRLLALLIAAVLLTGCSFHLRGQAGMQFETLYLDAANPGTAFIKELRHSLEASKVKLLDSPGQADVVLDIVSEIPDKQILTLDASGRVNEFELYYRVSLRAYDSRHNDLIPADEIEMRSDFPYDDNHVLAMEAEEALLYQNMRTDMVQQIVRRLGRIKPASK